MMASRLESAGWHSRSLSEADLRAGGIIGFIGAVAMVFFAVAAGSLLLVPPISLLIISTAEPPALALTAGLLIHLAFGVLFGTVYAIIYTFLTSKYSLAAGIPLGVIYGFALWSLNLIFIDQVFSLGLLSIPSALAVSSHLFFGFVVGFYPLLARQTK